MVEIIGRDRELRVAEGVLSRAREERVARVLRIAGTSGNGKTALAREIERQAAAGGWTTGYAAAHRIQSTLPLSLARRLAQVIAGNGDGTATVYASGLEAALSLHGANVAPLDAEAFEGALFQFIGAILMDRSLLVVVDDSQWADEQSLSLIVRLVETFADRAFVLATVERFGDTTEFAVDLADESIIVRELDEVAARRLARALMPEASDAAIAAVLEQARGRAIDIATIASLNSDHRGMTEESVAASMRNIVATDLAKLKVPTREFLQICTLIGDPLEYELLVTLWPDDKVLAFIGETSGRYLVQDADGLRIVHATVAQAIRETIAIEIPYRKRILAAFEKMQNHSVERYERMVEQAAACGDSRLERAFLEKLSAEAARVNALSLAASALERMLTIAPASREELVPTYTRLAQFYIVDARETDTIRVCEEALRLAASYGLADGIGSIVGMLLIARWHAGDHDVAMADLERFRASLTTPEDRVHLVTAAEYMAMHRFDAAAADAGAKEFASFGDRVPPPLALRHQANLANYLLRRGDEEGALRAIDSAQAIARTLPAVFGSMVQAVQLFHIYRYQGPAAFERATRDASFATGHPLARVLTAHAMLAHGSFADIAELSAEKLPTTREPMLRRALLSALTTAAALQGSATSDRIWQHVADEVAAFEQGARTAGLLPIAAAWLATATTEHPQRAKRILSLVLERSSAPSDLIVFTYPVLAVQAAKTLGDRAALERLASPETIWSDAQPWNRAQALLAVAAAYAALGKTDAGALLTQSAERFTELGAPYFSDFARGLLGTASQQIADKSATLGTTRREREIAALVADGLTNRQIAEKLVLSERTVEGHIANLFAKVNVSSRTQLAAWYLRITSSVA